MDQTKRNECQSFTYSEELQFLIFDKPFEKTVSAHFLKEKKRYLYHTRTYYRRYHREPFHLWPLNLKFCHTVLRLLDREDSYLYKLRVNNTVKFEMMVRSVGSGLFRRESQEYVRVARGISNNSRLNDVTEHSARQFVQAVTTTRLHHLQMLSVWKLLLNYIIVCLVATNQEDSCLDVNLPFWSEVAIHKFICLQYRFMSD